MDDIILLVLGLAALLFLTALMLPLARRINAPFTVLLAAMGILLGVALDFGQAAAPGGLLGELLHTLSAFDVRSDVIFFVLLPALVFESSLAIDARALSRDLGPIMFLAIAGVIISMVAVAAVIFGVTEQSLVVCLLLGAMVAATDPAAVVAIFKDIGAPKRLTLLVEGESLFNDATAIVLFTIMVGMITGESDPSFVGGMLRFTEVFLGGALLGWIAARVLLQILWWLEDYYPMVENTITVAWIYIVYVVAEHHLDISGVMAVVVIGLMIGTTGRMVMSKDGWDAQSQLWERIAFWSNSMIFVFAGMALPGLLELASVELIYPALMLILTAFAARFAILFGLMPVLGRVQHAFQVSTAFRWVMFWGGLRGAVALALALFLLEDPDVPPEVQTFVAALVAVVVMFTLFVNATTIRPMLSGFGLDRLLPTDLALRQRVLIDALTSVRREIAEEARRQEVEGELTQVLEGEYDEKVAILDTTEEVGRLDSEAWQQVALLMLVRLERHLHVQRMDRELCSPEVTRNLLSQNDRSQDAIREGGLTGYLASVSREMGYSRLIHRGVWLHRKLGWSGPLSRALAQRFANLQSERSVLREIQEQQLDQLCELVDSTRQRDLRGALAAHLRQVEDALDALEAQYPDYASGLRFNLLELSALRQEQDRYQQMFDEGVIGQEIFNDLMMHVRERREEAQRHPPLDLGLEPARLLEQVPLFQELDAEAIEAISAHLRPRLALPGEMLVRRGELGDSMFFISSGAAQVLLSDGDSVTLGSGEFFGEIALVKDMPRVADVQAASFTDLLVLTRRDFRAVIERDTTIRDAIERAAEERLG